MDFNSETFAWAILFVTLVRPIGMIFVTRLVDVRPAGPERGLPVFRAFALVTCVAGATTARAENQWLTVDAVTFGTPNLAFSLRASSSQQVNPLQATFEGSIYAPEVQSAPKPLTMRVLLEPNAEAQLAIAGDDAVVFKNANGQATQLRRFTSTFQAGNQTIRRTVLMGARSKKSSVKNSQAPDRL